MPDYKPPSLMRIAVGPLPRVPRDPRGRAQFYSGLGAGVLLSIATWALAFLTSFGVVAWIFLGVKAIALLACLATPPWRPVGIGLLTSVGVGLLVFCGFCGLMLSRI